MYSIGFGWGGRRVAWGLEALFIPPPSKMGPCLSALPAFKTSDPERVIFWRFGTVGAQRAPVGARHYQKGCRFRDSGISVTGETSRGVRESNPERTSADASDRSYDSNDTLESRFAPRNPQRFPGFRFAEVLLIGCTLDSGPWILESGARSPLADLSPWETRGGPGTGHEKSCYI